VARNTPKNSEENEPAEAATESKRKSKPTGNGKWARLMAFMRDPRVQKIMGIFTVLFSVFTLLACISFLFSGEHDQRLVLGQYDDQLHPNEHYSNWMGKIGAHVAWFFMNKYFGVGAIFFPLIIFAIGWRIWWGRDLLPFWKTIRLSALAMLFFPLAIGFAFHHRVEGLERTIEISCNPNLVGGYGHLATLWCTFTLGWWGTLMLLLFTVGAFLIFNFNHQVEAAWARFSEWWADMLKPNPKDDEEDDEEPTPLANAAPTAVRNEIAKPQETTIEVKTPIEEPEAPWQEKEVTFETEIQEEEQEEDEENQEVEEEDDEIEVQQEATQELEMEIEDSEEDSTDVEPTRSTTGSGGSTTIQMDDDFSVEVKGGEEELSEQEIQRNIESLGPFDPRLDLSRYSFPPVDLLKAHGGQGPQIDKEELEENKNKIVQTLNHYKIEIAKIKASIGPTVTLYEIIPAPGVRISKIKNLEDDIALSLAALGIRIIAPIPGKGTIGIEVPNSKPDVVSMRSLVNSEKFQNAEMELPVVLGKTISNENFVVDLAKMPHLLMAGATGQGKSVGLNAILVSLLYKKHPAEIKFVLVDPKKVELTLFNKIERHFLAKLPNEADAIITDVQKVVRTLQSLCIEMDTRYELLKTAGCRNIKEYNGKFVARRLNPENGHRFLPYIVLVVDEFADLIMTAGREVETPIARLAQLARAIGIHLIIATQRPSVNIITGTIKANFPARIAFRVTSKIDSRTILDTGGAEQLIGRGDMLYSTGNDLIRLQCGFVDTPEVEEITDYIGNQQAYPTAFHLPEVVDENQLEMGNFADEDRDELFEEAARIVVMTQQGSASMLQRKLKLGYNRAGRLVDQLEAAGIIGPFEGSKGRKVLFADEISLDQFLKSGPSNV
jgi:S-DNA-T family DNA segregation ATPase FtsK/SpoIIIE